MAGSGMRTMRINTQERAMSTDINRLQAFAQNDSLELLRYLLLVGTSGTDLGLNVEPSSIASPLRAEIFGNGFLVAPQAGSLNLYVARGLLVAIAPDGALDMGDARYVSDAGISTPGALVVTQNLAVSARIDVVECRINPVDATVTDSRDIFNASTGLFLASTVTKELKGQLEYRVRAGTAGAGFPGTDSGWLPLAVIHVPASATTVDDMTFWDVRPLLADRAGNLVLSPRDRVVIDEAHFSVDDFTDTNERRLAGEMCAVFGGRRIGGKIMRSTPGTEAVYVDMKHADNLAAGFAWPGSGFIYFYFMMPFGLPRWARYTDGPVGRVPREPRGILVASDTAPNPLTGRPSSAIALPTSLGFTSTMTSDGLCFGMVRGGSGAAGVRENRVYLQENAANISASSVVTTLDDQSAKWDLVEGTHYPRGARALYVSLFLSAVLPNVSLARVAGTLVVARGASDIARLSVAGTTWSNSSGASRVMSMSSGTIRIPLWPDHENAGANTNVSVTWAYLLEVVTGTTAGSAGASMQVHGWDM